MTREDMKGLGELVGLLTLFLPFVPVPSIVLATAGAAWAVLAGIGEDEGMVLNASERPNNGMQRTALRDAADAER